MSLSPAPVEQLHYLAALPRHTRSVSMVLRAVVEAAVTLHGGVCGAIHVIDPAKNALRLRAERGFGGCLDSWMTIVHDEPCSRAVTTRQRVVADVTEGAAASMHRRAVMEHGMHTLQCTPLISSGDETLGVLTTYGHATRHFNIDELQLLDLFAREAARAIERQRAAAALRALERREAFLLHLDDALRPLADPWAIKVTAAEALTQHLQLATAGFIDTEQDANAIFAEAGAGDIALATAPLFGAGRMLAYFYATQRPGNAWTTEQRALLRDVSDRTWAALQRAHAEPLQESEHRYRLASDAMQGSIYEYDASTGHVLRNARMLELLGETKDTLAPTAEAWTDRVHPEDRKRFDDATAQMYTEGKSRFEVEYRVRHRSGEWLWVWQRSIAVRDATGKLMRVIGTVLDVTIRHEAQDALQLAHHNLENRVDERTRELASANSFLRNEIGERRRAEGLQRHLLRQLVNAQEEERRRISRELHDQLGQQVSALSLKLTMLKRQTVDSALAQQLEQLAAITHQLDGDLDFLVWELRPTALDDLGLVAALSDFIETWSSHFDIAAQIDAREEHDRRLPREVATVLYRVAQEALSNVAKHAHATQVDVTVDEGETEFSLTIADNGVGFVRERRSDTHRGGLGLVGMEERVAGIGGTLSIQTAPRRGTVLSVHVPLPRAHPEAAAPESTLSIPPGS